MSSSSFLRRLGTNFLISRRYPLINSKTGNFASLKTSSGQTAEEPNAGETQIFDKLQAKFSPSNLQVQDVSGGCGDFYAINIVSPAFKGISIVKQHQMVQEVLKEEIRNIHGLQLKTSS